MSEPEISTPDEFSLCGHFLIAMPNMLDPSFAGSVVYMCEHSSKGAMGLVINRPTDLGIAALLDKIELNIETELQDHFPVMAGGPVAAERGFVLHTAPLHWNSSLPVNDRISLTTSKDILEAVAKGQAPEQWLITLGYAGWGEGQLEQELAQNAWLTVPANDEILFNMPLEERFASAYGLLGIDPCLLTGAAGHA
ncbi:MAG TPA: YqgE/AlgH family protein [Limnobacter sp.]|nr:YqgE/AlgH family protein [Limnobacter sp.]